MILNHQGNPVNGIDVARYQGPIEVPAVRPEWLSLLGIKAFDIRYGVDPEFQRNREAARTLNVPWVPLYIFLREPIEFGDMTQQMARYCQAIGRLAPGECAMLDWERSGISITDITECERILEVVYPGRWTMYVNDASPDMISWMNTNLSLPVEERIPLVHPDWRNEGWQAAERWDAAVWQTGAVQQDSEAWSQVKTLYPRATAVDVDWVRHPKVMDRVCGRTLPTYPAVNS